MTGKRNLIDEVYVTGSQLADKVKEIVEQGNVRRVLIQDTEGRTLLEVPLTLGMAAGAGLAVFAPILAAVGTVAALVTRAKIVVERYEEPRKPDADSSEPRSIEIEDDE
ncbi:MAG: DUF4342 domain-containing protein [Gemmatimonadaceae bacterium]|nr:DUF4342 domain-containing protein [Gloeobacterales cyanobacterium ES-bin-141]